MPLFERMTRDKDDRQVDWFSGDVTNAGGKYPLAVESL